MKNTCLTVMAAAMLGACATQDGATAGHNDPGSRVTQAVATPLADLNLVRGEIPAALVAAEKAPYATPPDANCTGLVADVQALDAALGPDLDTPASPGNPSLIERGAGAAGNAAIGAVRSTAENVIPFRGWVRKLTGAEKYSREVAAAIAAGTIRRAFLKGLGQSMGCSAPAAPRSAA